MYNIHNSDNSDFFFRNNNTYLILIYKNSIHFFQRLMNKRQIGIFNNIATYL